MRERFCHRFRQEICKHHCTASYKSVSKRQMMDDVMLKETRDRDLQDFFHSLLSRVSWRFDSLFETYSELKSVNQATLATIKLNVLVKRTALSMYRCMYMGESGPKVVQGPGGVTTSPTVLGPVLVWSQRNYLRLLLTLGYFKSSSKGCCPATLLRRKAGMKVNEWIWIFADTPRGDVRAHNEDILGSHRRANREVGNSGIFPD